DLQNTPDIAQTIAVTCLGLGVSCDLTGLHTLKIKETDRLEALKIELQKFGAKVRITNETLHMKMEVQKPKTKNQKSNTINTYNDHRMAMAFAPLSLKYTFTIKDADVVSKSYPDFWEHFNQLIK
ncbi:MAG TPA: 3-phosphoshikimate 1-carboxyvinyltransferase, partial [Flavobacteriaceae bacterium]|nr:3-phosphoshikimate 1-carboxyvinyltransferase [Flavobacteriaceae bacterium]